MEVKPVVPVFISKEQFENLVMTRNNVLIKLERDPFELNVNFGGVVMKIPTEARTNHHLCTKGTVVKSCEKIGWSKEEAVSGIGFDWLPSKNEIQDRDTVFLNYMAVVNAYNISLSSGVHKVFDIENIGICIVVHYGNLIMAERNNECFMLNGWTLMEMVDERKTNGFIYPDSFSGYSRRIMKVCNASQTEIKYFDDKNYFSTSEIPIKNGDVCLCDVNTDIPFEGEHDKQYGEKYIVQRTNILSIIENFEPNKVFVKPKGRKSK